MIVVYDSGLGGILSLNKIVKSYPNDKIIYFGDSKNAPYGNRPIDEVKGIIENNLDYFNQIGADDVILACNTICSTIDFNISRDIRLHDIITSTVKKVGIDKNAKILIFGTAITIKNGRYESELAKLGYHNVISHHLDLLAGYIEEFKDLDFIRNYLYHEFKRLNIEADMIILACTHYPIVEEIFKDYYNIPVINSIDINYDIESRNDGHELIINMKKSDKLINFLDKYLDYQYKFYEESDISIR